MAASSWDEGSLPWATFVEDLRVVGPHGPMFAGIIVFNPQGIVLHEEGWFNTTDAASKITLFAASTDDAMASSTIALGSDTFQVVRNDFGNLGAVGRHQRTGLLTQRSRVGVVATVIAWPYRLPTTWATMEAFGHRLRSAS
ncbi:hypothetical protein SDRG_00911 [Saprolegnia diclina VS20]|uniref:Profilin n=1 Tax=Saprolegnia diclina (strain VS20) TaxID=1156394 RepID=T0QV42_SAPDV|nr:hypothetical protein SDRG_00911 [Saprolegnia diclina VS20]EQC42069.1 hypothetical protein SDRG_00911 [Saprolegnia diclina VS20]|eukprot:XP_008604638.1 hypothetical protein SDRG_00911 [Saprolegnia diclina VS20]